MAISDGFANAIGEHHEQDVGILPRNLARVDRIGQQRHERVMKRPHHPFDQQV